ncbi:MAG: SpaA isopeptide-forming pilin-related protein [Methanomassiliicoccales archaeon]|nr:SpaA isopeptide-forming pilin-related protein [Methanomassiliicoccales archaeon]
MPLHGNYTVRETVPTGYYNTTSTSVNVTIDQSGEEVCATFLNTAYGSICVYKYEDKNGNGELDEGDAVVPGITIILYDAQKVEIANGTTGECGAVCFTGLMLGTYYVEEVLTAEWHAEGPTMKQVVVNESGEQVIEHFLNIRYGKICVFKFEDLNGDGVWQEGEPGVPNVVIELVQNCEIVRSGETNSTGWICFDLLPFGTYCVRENLALSDMDCCWYNSTPSRVRVTIDGENLHELVTFGNVKYGKICGFKYYDANANGQLDCNENGIYYWEIQLWLNGKLLATTHTDHSGHFCFAGLEFGNYTVKEVMQNGWYATGPTQWNVTIDRSGDREDVYFLNAQCGKICVYKYEDLNGDGQWQVGEPPLSNISIYLYKDDILVGSGVTNADGRICFENLTTGTYIVMEDIPCNWYATVDMIQEVIMNGQDATVTFLNAQYGCLGGYKFNDANGNGVRDMLTERGIAGWEIELYQDGVRIACFTTGVDGHYAFCGLRIGSYEVREVMQSGWLNTTPAVIVVSIDHSNQMVCHVDFLNMELNPCICVTKTVSYDTITEENGCHCCCCGGDEEVEYVLTYTVNVTNCGNVALYNVKVYDSLLNQTFYLITFGDLDGILGVGEWWTITYTYVIPENTCGDDNDGCGGWEWNWGCGGGCGNWGQSWNGGCGGFEGWSCSWGCGDLNGRNDGGCGGWNWELNCGDGCGGWEWHWSCGGDHEGGCGCCCGGGETTTCVITNIATAYGQWGNVEAGTWISDSAQVDFTVPQNEPCHDGHDGGCGGGCGGWNWNWGCGEHDSWNHGGCGGGSCSWGGDWGFGNGGHSSGCGGGCSWNLGMNSGCRWWGTCNDGMIGACYFHNAGPRSDDENPEEDQIERQEAPEDSVQ